MRICLGYIIGILLLCVGCSFEEQPDFRYVGVTGSQGCYTLQAHIPENWKIINAQLSPHEVIIDYDDGRRIGKQRYSSSNNLFYTDDSIQFRGVNRIGGLALLYFTKEEDAKGKFNPPIGTTKISSSIREQEAFAIFRTGNWLIIHHSIEKTGFGKLIHHSLRDPNHNREKWSFQSIDGKMRYNLVLNDKEKRSFLIDKYYGQHETHSIIGESFSGSEDRLKWSWQFKITPKQEMEK